MLRYAIEKLPEKKRLAYLRGGAESETLSPPPGTMENHKAACRPQPK